MRILQREHYHRDRLRHRKNGHCQVFPNALSLLYGDDCIDESDDREHDQGKENEQQRISRHAHAKAVPAVFASEKRRLDLSDKDVVILLTVGTEVHEEVLDRESVESEDPLHRSIFRQILVGVVRPQNVCERHLVLNVIPDLEPQSQRRADDAENDQLDECLSRFLFLQIFDESDNEKESDGERDHADGKLGHHAEADRESREDNVFPAAFLEPLESEVERSEIQKDRQDIIVDRCRHQRQRGECRNDHRR